MTPKSPEEQAAELYPMPNDPLGVPYYTHKIIFGERAAWLSRQAEVDELKRQLDAAWMFNENANAKIAAHDAEMCAFAEWVLSQWEMCDVPLDLRPLLKQFRNDK
jgi:hypothetical protein